MPSTSVFPSSSGTSSDGPKATTAFGSQRVSAARATSVSGGPTIATSRGVPHVLVSTGASDFGQDYKKFPWTIGWQPDYVAETEFT